MTQHDELTLLKHIILHEFPSTTREVAIKTHGYWNLHEDFTIEDGHLLNGTRIIIPTIADKNADYLLIGTLQLMTRTYE